MWSSITAVSYQKGQLCVLLWSIYLRPDTATGQQGQKLAVCQKDRLQNAQMSGQLLHVLCRWTLGMCR